MFVPKVDPTLPGGWTSKVTATSIDTRCRAASGVRHQRTDAPVLRHAQDEMSVQYSAHPLFVQLSHKPVTHRFDDGG